MCVLLNANTKPAELRQYGEKCAHFLLCWHGNPRCAAGTLIQYIRAAAEQQLRWFSRMTTGNKEQFVRQSSNYWCG